ncbi:unnamed protein product [Cylindrotheca closterium]|uniref:Uncharacterized protein n=1 Tax=Cylindrotheca closterium TaxID=2856 RepID=A0AAD2CCJ7_9STRA|nr:unnamed protein product [Cylindrotheca closterium]
MTNLPLLVYCVILLFFHVCVCAALAPNECRRSNSSRSRRSFLIGGGLGSIIAAASSVSPSFAAETVGKDKDCNDQFCIGVWDGLLADCPHAMSSGSGCTSSQDDTPGIFAEPWDYAEAPNNTLDWQVQMRLLVPTIQLVSARRGDDAQILVQQERYLRVLFTDGKTGEKSMGEFYFTPDDTTVQFRIASLGSQVGGLLSRSFRNLERSELIRKELKYLKVPVLRNRKRSLFFVESDLDSFGPGSAALGPPAEMKTGELEGRGSDNVDPKLKIDFLQQFPKSF